MNSLQPTCHELILNLTGLKWTASCMCGQWEATGPVTTIGEQHLAHVDAALVTA